MVSSDSYQWDRKAVEKKSVYAAHNEEDAQLASSLMISGVKNIQISPLHGPHWNESFHFL